MVAQLGTVQGFKRVFVPSANADEAAFTKSIEVNPVDSFHQLYLHLIGEDPFIAIPSPVKLKS